jgi:chemosensory pili system protein ChpA (sensor histidine kinase/response regulator)
MPEIASQTLEFVGRELNATLGEARTALENYVEQPANVALLERCATDLHQVQGVLRVLEIYGAALLAEEMEHVARYLLATAGERKSQAESLDALMRAMVQLPGYLERVLAGGRDLALVLLPLLNDLRAVRGNALLSEGTLLLLNLKSDKQAQPLPAQAGEAALTIEQHARKLRARFQVGLIGWIRGERIEQNLEALSSVAQKLEQIATRQPIFQLWWVVGAVIEALQEGGLEGGVSVKRLLGLADREVKRLYEQGEGRYSQSPPVELLNNLLYYVGRAESAGPRVTSVRSSFRLSELLPVDEAVEQERENLSAPSVKLMQTVASAIREDLGKVKDVLDIFVRRGGAQPQELTSQVELLRKIGDTLGVLGLGELRTSVQAQTARLTQIVAGKLAPQESTLVEIAAELIAVEDRLDDRLVGMILPRKAAGTAEEQADAEFRQVQSAVLRECMANLARIKEAVAQNVGGTLDAAGLDAWPQLLRGMQAGLLMLGKMRAVEILESITGHLKRVMRPGGGAFAIGGLDRLADAIVSVEYYMETLQAGRSDPWYMLDNAQTCLDALADQAPLAVPTVAPVDPDAFAATLNLTATGVPSLRDDAGTTDIRGAAPTLSAKQAGTTHVPVTDPELVNLFIDEAREELGRIGRHFPQWDQNPLERDALVTVRRSFHTLKGSGRMVGARELSEFSWAIENLVNRLLDNTLTRSPQIITTLREAIAVLPELVEHLASGTPPRSDAAGIVTRAHALAASKPPPAPIAPEDEVAAGTTGAYPRPTAADGVQTIVIDTSLDSTRPRMPAARGRDAHAAAAAAAREDTNDEEGEPDQALRDIYVRETSAHIAAVRAWLGHQHRRAHPHTVTDDVYRACHTLAGSSKMAEARHGVRLAEPLDHWVRKAHDSGAGLMDGDLVLIGDCMTAMQGVAAHLDESTGYFVAHEALLARIADAEADLDRRIVQAAEAAQAETAAPVPPPAAPPPRPVAHAEPGADAEAAADYDPEVAAIFSEEATELIDTSEAALAAWREEPKSLEHLAALKRPLHTLKGGARMAGVVAMGDLSHELETLLMQVESGAVQANDAAFDAMQASVDELARMRERIVASQSVPAAQAVIARIHALSRGSRAPAPPPAADPPRPAMAPVFAERPAAPERPVLAERQLFAEKQDRERPQLGATVTSIASARQGGESAASAELAPPLPVPPGREPVAPAERAEMARVDAELLDQLLNSAGEVSIARARLEQQIGSIDFNLGELSRTVTRLKEQLRKLEIETEAQILHRHEEDTAHRSEFDPLELDRYSSIQQFSRALAETANDVASIQGLLESLAQDTQNLLTQQARTITELQNGLMRTRMVPFQRHVQRLARIVRQAASDTGKQAELVVEGASGELDRQVLERMLPPFEHLLRNAVVHGIEKPAERAAKGKPEGGRITLELHREGAEVMVRVTDDGSGMNLQAIREKGAKLGLVKPGQVLSDEDAMQLILEPGFSTAGSVTQQAGRGVGMDVVATEIKKLGGALHMETTTGSGTTFTIRLPFTLAISHALVVRTSDEYYALPLPTVEGVLRLTKSEVSSHLGRDAPTFEHNGQRYRFQHLAQFVGLEPSPLPDADITIPVVLVRAGEHSTGLVADELIGSREIVVKSVGPQISAIRGISGATILGDGRIVVILDIGELVRGEWRGRQPTVTREKGDRRTFALVVDDSITVRRVTQRLLERNGMRVLTARDGMDAVALLQEHVPDIILLDIEMPRMDGYEVAAHVRNDPRLADTPIIMITSRVGEKHRARAIELGVNDYLGKPYQEAQLLDAIAPLVQRHRENRMSRTMAESAEAG